jgi:hypothetical protein
MTQEQYIKCIEIERLAINIRAIIIDITITIESVISEILLDTLSTQKTRDSIERHLLSNVLSFDQRITLFSSFVKHGAFDPITIDNNLSANLSYIRKIRNLMAHSMLDTSIDFIETFDGESICFKSFTAEGTKNTVIRLGKGHDKVKSGLYFEQSILGKLYLTLDIVQMIYKGLNPTKVTDSPHCP